MESIRHASTLWRWTGGNDRSWFFLTIDGDAGDLLSATRLMRRLERGAGKGFGSIKVFARIGDSRWQTSVFPQKGSGWLLPVKAAIRRAEAIDEGDAVDLVLEL